MENGKYIFRRPASPTAIHPFMVPGDTGLFVDLLVHSPPKQDLLAVSEMASDTEYMKLWSEVSGVPSQVQEIAVEEADKAAPGGIGREAAESTGTSAEFGWGKYENVKTTNLRKYMESEDWVQVMIASPLKSCCFKRFSKARKAFEYDTRDAMVP